ncbi:Pyridoxamine 5'-phosphate oxidase [Nonomuraea coxensis DSM 45129]|uniref:Pyridoxamine 5'-phosphate oxidase n=1 Tax=Nonomuraea coxensis DSM 45129 TaxID=1122611 RepID=A0ABX8TYV8_9ACTN|nr:TIGR03668 family PPOX class F420-dependent oxidoreductase [Nonomuraea coxensis]QYC39553.1 Pyridoxamine 5'-phosphate oxidase [Nonomuraea coxensis DSM 45129]
MDEEEARRRFAGARVARLATVRGDGAPRLVPVVFAVIGERVVFAVDHKPKTTTDLRRLSDIRADPRVGLLADHYDEDWSLLWWVRADGLARVAEDGPEREAALDALTAKYPQYRERRPAGPAVVVEVTRRRGWAATPPP